MENANNELNNVLLQTKEFEAWGLSKGAVRNIVVLFIVVLISGITTLFGVIIRQDERHRRQLERLEQLNRECYEEHRKTVERLKNEQEKMIIQYVEQMIELRQANMRFEALKNEQQKKR